jgi:hypothetical protein
MKGFQSVLLLDVLYTSKWVNLQFLFWCYPDVIAIQIRCIQIPVDVFKDYSKTSLLLRFVCVEFRVLTVKLFHDVYICDIALWLDLNLLSIYDLYLIFASGEFF